MKFSNILSGALNRDPQRRDPAVAVANRAPSGPMATTWNAANPMRPAPRPNAPQTRPPAPIQQRPQFPTNMPLPKPGYAPGWGQAGFRGVAPINMQPPMPTNDQFLVGGGQFQQPNYLTQPYQLPTENMKALPTGFNPGMGVGQMMPQQPMGGQNDVQDAMTKLQGSYAQPAPQMGMDKQFAAQQPQPSQFNPMIRRF